MKIGQYTDGMKTIQEGQSNAYLGENVSSRPQACQSKHKNITKESAMEKNQTRTNPLPAEKELTYINSQISPSFKDIENLTSQVSDMEAEKVHIVIPFFTL